MPSKLGEKISKQRKKQGDTLEELADKAKISKSYLWELENRDEPPSLSAEKLTRLADALGVTVGYLLDDDIREPEEKHVDEAFYRSYQNLEAQDKGQLRKILEAFKKE